MKKIFQYILVAVSLFSATSCDNFIEVEPEGVIDEQLAMENPEKMTTAAYAMLGDCWYSYPSMATWQATMR